MWAGVCVRKALKKEEECVCGRRLQRELCTKYAYNNKPVKTEFRPLLLLMLLPLPMLIVPTTTPTAPLRTTA
jgi:hypothetical protein